MESARCHSDVSEGTRVLFFFSSSLFFFHTRTHACACERAMDEDNSRVLGAGSSSGPQRHFTLSALPYVAAYCVVLVVHTVDLFVPQRRSRRALDAEQCAAVNDTTAPSSGRRSTRRSTTVSQVYGRWSDHDRHACTGCTCTSLSSFSCRCCTCCCCGTMGNTTSSSSGSEEEGNGRAARNGALGVRASGLFRLLVPAFFVTRIAWWLLASAGAAPYEGVARVLNRLAFTFFVVLFGVLALLLGDALAIAIRDPAATRFAPLALTGTLELGFLKRRTRVVYLLAVGVLCATVLALAVADVAAGVSTSSWPYLASTLLMAAMCLALAAAFLVLGALLVRHLRNAAVSRAVLAKVALYCAAMALCFLSRAFFLSYRILFHAAPRCFPPWLYNTGSYCVPELGPVLLFLWIGHQRLSAPESDAWQSISRSVSSRRYLLSDSHPVYADSALHHHRNSTAPAATAVEAVEKEPATTATATTHHHHQTSRHHGMEQYDNVYFSDSDPDDDDA